MATDLAVSGGGAGVGTGADSVFPDDPAARTTTGTSRRSVIGPVNTSLPSRC
jgi:hypothetical protein